jgi:CRISPR/Cas system-associated endonuclease/helicase Cas3
MASLRPLLYKLQAAHSAKGRRIYISQFQSYSEKAERMVTKIVLSEKRNGKMHKLFESWNIHEAIQYLADELK